MSVLVSVKDGIVSVLISIKDGVLNVITSVVELPGKIGTTIMELLKTLFIPTYNPIEETKKKLEEKVGFVHDCYDMVSTAIKEGSADAPPKFQISYKGYKLDIVDFSMFSDYRSTVHAIIIGLFWFRFLLWLLKQVRVIIQPSGGTA